MKYALLLLTFISATALGQDYVITIHGDTLTGKVKPQGAERIERVKIVTAKETKNLSALQVKEYTYKNNTYRPIQYENMVRFMQVIKSGYVSLLAYRLEGQTTLEGRLLVKMDGSKLEVPNINFKRMLTNFLKECTDVNDKIAAGDYGRKDLDKMINEFNSCMDAKTAAQKVSVAKAVETLIKVAPLEKLEKNLTGLADFSEKKDALDLIHDMQDKIKAGKSIPNYQLEALKGILKDKAEVKEDLEKALADLKGN